MDFDLSELEQSLPTLPSSAELGAGIRALMVRLKTATFACLSCFVVGKECAMVGSEVACVSCIAAGSPCMVFANVGMAEDVEMVAVKVDETLTSAMMQLEASISNFTFAVHWRENLRLLCRRLVVDGGTMTSNFDARVAMYATVAARLRVVMMGREFLGLDVIPFVDIAELYGVLKDAVECNTLSEYEKVLLAFKVIRQLALSGEKTDIFQNRRMAVAVAKECLEGLRMKEQGLYA
ncbi:hypothetical protein GALMADRAFT_207963 [Galerina marginata CBS 339.88]|uniref:Uncharacterized protein n=1 Tax=Galerina marginata (strain CBS 339.88) TaxID=685588 RepID=A0A067TFI2_GALM3|nr:hypothetical protein GALMADRAFT_207963 [Galerina marginata CBS 339.88]